MREAAAIVKRACALVAAGVLGACGTTTDRSPPLGDSDAATSQIAASGPSCSFAPAPLFALPPTHGVDAPLREISGRVPCASGAGTYDYGLRDMDGDQREDLVVTRACNDASVGVTAWLVYPATDAGFGAPVRFDLPLLPGPPGCAHTALVDVDGDRRPDLVVTSQCTDASIGTRRWLVHRNTGGGFAPDARVFSLPPANAPGIFSTLEVTEARCSSLQPAYAFFDLTGDRIPDFVVTTACDDRTVGVSHWRVYPGTGAGAAAPVDFALPPGGTFATPLRGELACRASLPTPRYAVLDFDGDLKPDLVVTRSCVDPSAGSTRWLVYPNDGTSFAQREEIVPLPLVAHTAGAPFEALAATVPCASGAAVLSHVLTDVDGDLAPDLLLTRDCTDAAVGVQYWRVFHNRGTSFAPGSAYALPLVLGASPGAPAGLGGALVCGDGAPRAAFVAEPLLGPELDLTVTATCTDPTIGDLAWLLFRPGCPGSAPDAGTPP